ncbi:MAG: hypothetical protein JO144_00040, partial [Actinobacteria bacterium]|nr:hypothetical protein [Actinomycetota bacterium]
MGKQCVFCGRDGSEVKITREHVFPDWISDYLNRKNESGTHFIVGLDDSEQPVAWSDRYGQTKVRRLCKDCNNEWLGVGLERPVKAFLGPMLLGRTVDLSVESQALLAFWAAKTALVSELLKPDAASVPAQDYREMRRLSQALPTQCVWVGYRHERPDRQLVALTTGWPQPDRQKVAYAKTIAVGSVVFLVFGHNLVPGALWAA